MPNSYGIEMPDDEPPSVQTKLVIGEIDVDIQTHVSCGSRWWYGTFPDKSHCCRYWAHETRQEAVLCSELRVAKGFVLKRPSKGLARKKKAKKELE